MSENEPKNLDHKREGIDAERGRYYTAKRCPGCHLKMLDGVCKRPVCQPARSEAR